jgi:hypothetical protein
MKQCFAVDCLEDGKWKIAFAIIDTRKRIEADLPKLAERNGIALEGFRLRWIWTVAEANRLMDIGVTIFGNPGRDVAWIG